MSRKEKSNSFIIQGSILAFAGIMVRIIGLIYRIPLNRILGPNGINYYATAFDIYNVLLLLSSQSMPLAVSKIVSEKLSKNENKNAHKAFKGAMIYAIILGLVVGLFAFFGAEWIARVCYDTPEISRPLKILAPTLTIVCVLGVMRGYFQGMGNMVPTALSQIFEQIINAIVSVFAAYELTSIAVTAHKSSKIADSYGATGGTMGTLAGAITALIVIIVIYAKHKKSINEDIAEGKDYTDGYSTITKKLIWTITPVLISTTIYNISNLLDNPIYKNIMSHVFNMDNLTRDELWGKYSGYYRVLTTMPIAIAAALSTAIVPSIVRSFTQKDNDTVKEKVMLAIKFSMIIALPCGIGLSVLGHPINQMLFGAKSGDTVLLMSFSILTVFTFSLSTISNAILQGIDKLNVPIKNSAISLVIHLILLPVMLIVFKWGIYAVVIGDITFGLTVSILNAYSIKKYLGYKQEVVNTFIRPFICALIMGCAAYGVYYIGVKTIHISAISTLLGIGVAGIVYGLCLILFRVITEAELLSIPKGTMLIRVFKKFHLM